MFSWEDEIISTTTTRLFQVKCNMCWHNREIFKDKDRKATVEYRIIGGFGIIGGGVGGVGWKFLQKLIIGGGGGRVWNNWGLEGGGGKK